MISRNFCICLSPFLGCYNDTMFWVSYKLDFISHSSGGWRISGLRCLQIPYLVRAHFLVIDGHLFAVSSCGWRGKGACLGLSFMRVLIPWVPQLLSPHAATTEARAYQSPRSATGEPPQWEARCNWRAASVRWDERKPAHQRRPRAAKNK